MAMSSGAIVFGSISGYIGIYDKQSKSLKYVEMMFDELVREISIDPVKDKFKAVIGDRYIIIGDFSNWENTDVTR